MKDREWGGGEGVELAVGVFFGEERREGGSDLGGLRSMPLIHDFETMPWKWFHDYHERTFASHSGILTSENGFGGLNVQLVLILGAQASSDFPSPVSMPTP